MFRLGSTSPDSTKVEATLIALLMLCGCGEKSASGPMPHRAYVWQREWAPAVVEAVKLTQADVMGHAIFGGEAVWQQSQPKWRACDIDWAALRTAARPVTLVMRVAPHPGPFDDLAVTQQLVEMARTLLKTCADAGVSCAELQLDFDCGQKKLLGYANWLRALRDAVKPMRFVITTLPAWLDEPAFKILLREVDGYVLQVHSVMPAKPGDPVMICDPERARRCVAAAAKLGVPFEVALPTYSALAGMDTTGRVMGYVFEGPAPQWPAGTQARLYETSASSMAALVKEWTLQRPDLMQGVIWFRLPLTTDARNWPLVTWRAVKEGRAPTHQWSAKCSKGALGDVTLHNDGEAKSSGGVKIVLSWVGAELLATEALPGFQAHAGKGSVTFQSEAGQSVSLSPAASRAIGWLRFKQPAQVHVEVTPLPPAPH
jgi:hypothetical protein